MYVKLQTKIRSYVTIRISRKNGPLLFPWWWWKKWSISQQHQPGISIMKNFQGYLVPSAGNQAMSIKQTFCFFLEIILHNVYNDKLNKILWRYRFLKKEFKILKQRRNGDSQHLAPQRHYISIDLIGTTPKIKTGNSRMFEPEF